MVSGARPPDAAHERQHPRTNTADRGFPDPVADLIGRRTLAPGQLVLEITEGSLLSDLPAPRAVGEQLWAIGAPLALDDFGAGYSWLLHLRQIPLRYLETDRGPPAT